MFPYWKRKRCSWRIKLFWVGRGNQVSSRASFRGPMQHMGWAHLRVQPNLPEPGCVKSVCRLIQGTFMPPLPSHLQLIKKSKDQGEQSPGVLNSEEEAAWWLGLGRLGSYSRWGVRNSILGRGNNICKGEAWQIWHNFGAVSYSLAISLHILISLLEQSSTDMQSGVMSLASWEHRGLVITNLVNCGSQASIPRIHKKCPSQPLIMCYSPQVNMSPLRPRRFY